MASLSSSSSSSALGILFVLFVAWIFSKDRSRINWRTVGWGLLLQFVFAILILGIPRFKVPGVFRIVFTALGDLVSLLIGFTDKGAEFMFGGLAHDQPQLGLGYLFAFRALPTIIFFSSLVAVLYHLGILQRVVRGIAWVMLKTFRSSGAESLSAAANIFIGQTEAPLLVRPYLKGMTESEIFCVMVGGMATIAAGVMGAYVGLLQGRIPDIAGHLLTASAMAAPAAIMISKILVPEKGVPETLGVVKVADGNRQGNVVEAAARGAEEGLQLALAVGAMLIAFIGLVALLDWVLGLLGHGIHFASWGRALVPWFPQEQELKLSFAVVMGWLLAPMAWLMGIPWSEAPMVGKLLGEKVILNEFVAYVSLSKMPQLSDRSIIITSYALCGFANLSSIGIQIGGIGSLAPNQKGTLARLGLYAVLGGSLACFLTASIAALLF